MRYFRYYWYDMVRDIPYYRPKIADIPDIANTTHDIVNITNVADTIFIP